MIGDFEDYFDVMPFHHVIFDPDWERNIENNNIFEDEKYLSRKSYYDDQILKYTDFMKEFETNSNKARETEMCVVKWINNEKGFGLFSKKYFYLIF